MPRALLRCVWALMASLAAAACPVSDPAGLPGTGDETHALRRELESLRAERELARGEGFYLKLDIRLQRIALVLAGVTLQEHALQRIETGVRRVAFLERSFPSELLFQAHARGRLSPARERDRLEIEAPAPSPPGDAAALEPAPPPLSPTAEEAYSVPARYRIVFEDGVAVEVLATGGGRNRTLRQRSADALRRRALDLANALRESPTERVHLRIALDPEDAASLYRSLPPDVGLVISGLAASSAPPGEQADSACTREGDQEPGPARAPVASWGAVAPFAWPRSDGPMTLRGGEFAYAAAAQGI